MRQNYEQKLIFGEDATSSGKRMAAVKLMLDQNINTMCIGSVVGVSERQVYYYKRQIKGGGNIYADRHYRPVSDMDAADAEIIKSLKEEPVASAREAAKRIEKITGLKRGNTQIRKFMRKHGLKPLKTASLPAKMDPVAQRKFLEEELEPRLARAKGESGEVNDKSAITENPVETETSDIVVSSGIKAAGSPDISQKPETASKGSDELAVIEELEPGFARAKGELCEVKKKAAKAAIAEKPVKTGTSDIVADSGIKVSGTPDIAQNQDTPSKRLKEPAVADKLEPRHSRAKEESCGVKEKAAITENAVEAGIPTIVVGSGIKAADSPDIAQNQETVSKELKEPEITLSIVAPDIDAGKCANGTEAVQPQPDKQQESVIFFMDAVHCVWQAVLGVLWSVERIFIPAASGRKRVNVLGAYDPVANKLLKIITRTYINSFTVCDMLNQIAAAYMGKIITVVLDNARYQHCDLVKNTAKALGIELLFLPTYSPNLNLIERLWKFLKAKCLRNEFYNTSKEFECAITECLDKISTEYADEVKRLMSMKFHLYDTFDEYPTYYGRNKKSKVVA